ncbi:hypothetical protein [Enterococcus gallinarum]|uniref:hypothetical protein n=1 Tax=Enterococcus gallinarum TaxID=1353 RepID=UPI0012E2DA53|nr:hypothetical protein [Enterococcus gallinarum]MUO32771.1 hypothetical protein [Enterococcus gallinarum]
MLRITAIGLRSKTELMMSSGDQRERSDLSMNHYDWLAKQRVNDEQRRPKGA